MSSDKLNYSISEIKYTRDVHRNQLMYDFQ